MAGRYPSQRASRRPTGDAEQSDRRTDSGTDGWTDRREMHHRTLSAFPFQFSLEPHSAQTSTELTLNGQFTLLVGASILPPTDNHDKQSTTTTTRHSFARSPGEMSPPPPTTTTEPEGICALILPSPRAQTPVCPAQLWTETDKQTRARARTRARTRTRTQTFHYNSVDPKSVWPRRLQLAVAGPTCGQLLAGGRGNQIRLKLGAG